MVNKVLQMMDWCDAPNAHVGQEPINLYWHRIPVNRIYFKNGWCTPKKDVFIQISRVVITDIWYG